MAEHLREHAITDAVDRALPPTGRYFGVDMPVPAVDPDTEWFWEACRTHRFLVQRCSSCRRFRMMPRPVCPFCRSFDWRPEQSAGTGTVYSFTIVHFPAHPATVGSVPYNVAVVQLDDCGRVKVTSNIVALDNARIACGIPVQLVWDDLDDRTTLYRFAPAESVS